MLILLIIVAVIVLIVLSAKGVFNKPAPCKHCGKHLKGTEQQIFGEGTDEFVLCNDCASKINKLIYDYAKMKWNYTDYMNYLKWDEETAEERNQFQPDYTYGYDDQIMLDTSHALFSIKRSNKQMVFRIVDMDDYMFDFTADEIKDGVFSTRVKGNEIYNVDMQMPRVFLEGTLKWRVSCEAKAKGFLSTKYEYRLTDEYTNFIRAFTATIYYVEEVLEQQEQGYAQEQEYNISEVQKALALFMFDSMEDVTADNLRKQRNSLIKAFHPDNNEQNEEYSQKINAAYDLLSGMIKTA